MTQSVEEHQEVPKKEATVMPVGRLRKWHRDWTLGAERCQSHCESKKRMTIAGKMTSRHAKGMAEEGECTRDNVASRTQRGHTSEMRPWTGPECNNGIRDRCLNQKLQGRIGIKDPDPKLQLCLRIVQAL
jgi:hypothetical protein